MAKVNPLLILVVLLVVAFIVLIIFSRPKYLPYEQKKTNYAKYEPMESIADSKKDTPKKTEESKLIEFESEGIKYSILRDSEIIDKFSQLGVNGVDGVNGCVSSGLSNSGGYICLTPELISLLKTRGGNATGK